MKTKVVLLALIALLIASSCTIEQKIKYNEDMSGNNEIIVNYGGFLEQMGGLTGGEEDFTEDLALTESMNEITDAFQDIKGISNVKPMTNSNKGIVGFSFDFKDTKALDGAMNNYWSGEEESPKKSKTSTMYELKKKTLSLNFDNKDFEEILGEESEDISAMMNMFDYSISIELPFPVKSISNKNYTLSNDGKTIQTTVNLQDYVEGTQDLSVKVKW
jgi:hypothetical protein